MKRLRRRGRARARRASGAPERARIAQRRDERPRVVRRRWPAPERAHPPRDADDRDDRRAEVAEERRIEVAPPREPSQIAARSTRGRRGGVARRAQSCRTTVARRAHGVAPHVASTPLGRRGAASRGIRTHTSSPRRSTGIGLQAVGRIAQARAGRERERPLVERARDLRCRPASRACRGRAPRPGGADTWPASRTTRRRREVEDRDLRVAVPRSSRRRRGARRRPAITRTHDPSPDTAGADGGTSAAQSAGRRWPRSRTNAGAGSAARAIAKCRNEARFAGSRTTSAHSHW